MAGFLEFLHDLLPDSTTGRIRAYLVSHDLEDIPETRKALQTAESTRITFKYAVYYAQGDILESTPYFEVTVGGYGLAHKLLLNALCICSSNTLRGVRFDLALTAIRASAHSEDTCTLGGEVFDGPHSSTIAIPFWKPVPRKSSKRVPGAE